MPLKPRYRYIIQPKKRLPRGKIVTIAAGILCKNGVVLCADTEHTISDDRKFQGPKLNLGGWHYPFEDYREHRDRDVRLTIGFGGAGHSEWITGFIQGMNREVLWEVPDEFNPKIFEKLLENYSHGYFEKYIKGYAENPNHRPQVHMLVLAHFGTNHDFRKTHAIYRIHDNLVLRTEEDEPCMAVGAGAAVFQSLASSILGKRPQMWWNVKQAASIAIYIMAKVKEEVAGCGGNTHVIMVRDYTWDHIPTSKIRKLELHHLKVESEMYSTLAQKLIEELPSYE